MLLDPGEARRQISLSDRDAWHLPGTLTPMPNLVRSALNLDGKLRFIRY